MSTGTCEPSSKVERTNTAAWLKWRRFENTPSKVCNDRTDILNSAIELARLWVECATELDGELNRNAIPDIRLIGDRMVPIARASKMLFDRIYATVQSQSWQDCFLENENDFLKSRADMEAVFAFMSDWPTSCDEARLAIKEEIARGETYPAREIKAECGTN